MSIYEAKKGQIAGFEVIGYRQKDGSVQLGNPENGDILTDFPNEIKTPYGIFQLESIKSNDEEDKLPNDHPGKNIEWGIYV